MADDQRYSRRSGPRDRNLRVGNVEREAVAEILRQEHVAGRLDSDELDERLGRSLAARTYAELDQLITDFPQAELERSHWTQPSWHRRPWPLIFLPLIALAIVFSHGRAAWLVIPFFFWFVVRPFVWGYRWRGAGWRSYARRT